LSTDRKIGAVIPAHNEAGEIGPLVDAVRGRIPLVLVVDDGSSDGTGAVAAAHGAEVVRHEVCRGKGAALKTGFARLLGQGCAAAVTMDGDGQHRPEDLEAFLRAWRIHPGTDVFVGSRKITGTDMPFIRRATNLAMSLLISFIAFQLVPDTQNGFRLIRRNVLSSVRTGTSHFDMETEFLIKASWRGFRIRPVPVATIYRDERSKIRPMKDTTRFFRMLLGLFADVVRHR
jgi:polyprenyl-phospho-N-acetylgalactosaminyl synthase